MSVCTVYCAGLPGEGAACLATLVQGCFAGHGFFRQCRSCRPARTYLHTVVDECINVGVCSVDYPWRYAFRTLAYSCGHGMLRFDVEHECVIESLLSSRPQIT